MRPSRVCQFNGSVAHPVVTDSSYRSLSATESAIGALTLIFCERTMSAGMPTQYTGLAATVATQAASPAERLLRCTDLRQVCGPTGLVIPGAAGDPPDDPPGAVPVQPPPVCGKKGRSLAPLADGQAGCPRGARGERDGDDLAALAGDGAEVMCDAQRHYLRAAGQPVIARGGLEEAWHHRAHW
jgi:hypothetical protein